jgi:hypothetical protein
MYRSFEPVKRATEFDWNPLPPALRAVDFKPRKPRVSLRSTLGFMLPSAIADSLKTVSYRFSETISA